MRGRAGRRKATMTDTDTTKPDTAMAAIVITVDHVYLPLDENGDGIIDWPVSNVSTSKVLRRARLKVPVDLACFLSDRDQAEIL
jgi:hypothetical protein